MSGGELAVGIATEAINNFIVAPFIRQIDDAINVDRNRQLLQDKLQFMEQLSQDISKYFENRHAIPQECINCCLERTRVTIEKARSLMDQSNSQQRCSYLLFCKPQISGQLRECRTSFDALYEEIKGLFIIFPNFPQTASSSAGDRLQSMPDGGFIGSAMKSAQEKLQKYLTEAPEPRVIGLYGRAGSGKTSLLRQLYNTYKVSNNFDHVIWVPVSQNYSIAGLQSLISYAIQLDLSRTSVSDIDNRRMMLLNFLSQRKFLLILDDLWERLNFEDLGVESGNEKGSKVVFSTRNFALAKRLAEGRTVQMELLSTVEARELFDKEAFKGKEIIPDDIKECARNIADQCECLPLAITVVAAAMKDKTTADEWNTFLSSMKNADLSGPDHTDIGKELYQRIKLSYDAFPDSEMKNCFLYSAMYPGGAKINVETLVRMWISEGLVKTREGTYESDMARGRSYLKDLINRCMFENVNFEKVGIENGLKATYIRLHDVVRLTAIYVGEEDGKNYLRPGLRMRHFPQGQDCNYNCQRMSLFRNQIEQLPTDFKIGKLVSLILSENPSLHAIPESFFKNLTCLRVLDLSHTDIQSLPTSLTQLTQLEFLSLANTKLIQLPDDICSLSRLRFVDLSNCINLSSLPCTIGKLTRLEYLNISHDDNLEIPSELSQLSSLKRLELGIIFPTTCVALKGLRNLTNVNLTIGSKVKQQEIMEIWESWVEMRHLTLCYNNPRDPKLRSEMLKMVQLQSLKLFTYQRIDLPDWICEFRHIQRLELIIHYQLTQFPPLEELPNLKVLKLGHCSKVRDIGIGATQKQLPGFPKLEKLDLVGMPHLESMAGPSTSNGGGVLKEGTLSNLAILKIKKCPMLKTLPMGLEKLTKLEAIIGSPDWWENIKCDEMKVRLEKLFTSPTKQNT